MLYDQNGNVISESSPDLDEVRRSYAIEKSKHASGGFGEFGLFNMHPQSLGRLSNNLLRHIYEVSSSVRPAVDGISRSVSHLPWNVIHRDMKFHPLEEAQEVVDFLEHPNADGEDLPDIIAKFLNDMLVVGKGVIEKVRNPFGRLIELVARDASLFKPIHDPHGAILGYQEFERNSLKPLRKHAKENIIFKYFTPTSYTEGGVPIIETVVNEIALLMLSVKAIGWAFTHDEIPPGVLHLGLIGEQALERAKASFEAARGIVGGGSAKIRVIDNVDKADWIQFTRPFRENQVAELMPMIERIVARNFGLSPVESNLSSSGQRDAEISVRASQSRLILPLMDAIQNALTHNVVRLHDSSLRFKYTRAPQEKVPEQAQANAILWRSGIITPNEGRFNMGFNAVPGGDTRTVLLGNEVVPFDPDTGLPIPRKKEEEEQPGPGRPAVPTRVPRLLPQPPSEDDPRPEEEREEESALEIPFDIELNDDDEFEEAYNLDQEDEDEKAMKILKDEIVDNEILEAKLLKKKVLIFKQSQVTSNRLPGVQRKAPETVSLPFEIPPPFKHTDGPESPSVLPDSERKFYDQIHLNRSKFLKRLKEVWAKFKTKYLKTIQKQQNPAQEALFEEMLANFETVANSAFEDGIRSGNDYFEGTFRVKGLSRTQQQRLVQKQLKIFKDKSRVLFRNDVVTKLEQDLNPQSVLSSFDRFLLGYANVAVGVAYEIFARNTDLLNTALRKLFSIAGQDFPKDPVKVEWRLFEGAEHSEDCKRMSIGKLGTGYWDARELAESGILPASSLLDCGGNCRCHLSPVVALSPETANWLKNVTPTAARKDVLNIIPNITEKKLGDLFDKKGFSMSRIVRNLIITDSIFRRSEFFNGLRRGGLRILTRSNQPKFQIVGETNFIRRAGRNVPANIELRIDLPADLRLNQLTQFQKEVFRKQLAHEIGHTIAVFDPATATGTSIINSRIASELMAAANTERATTLLQLRQNFDDIVRRVPKRKLSAQMRQDINLIRGFLKDPDDFVDRLITAVLDGKNFGGVPARQAYDLFDRVLQEYATGINLTRGYQLYTPDEFFAEWFSLLLTDPAKAALFNQRLNKIMAERYSQFFETAVSRRAETLLPTSTALGFRTDLPRPSGFTPLGPNLTSFTSAVKGIQSQTNRITTGTVRRQITEVIKNVPNIHRQEFFRNLNIAFLDKFQMAARTGSRQHIGFFENGTFFVNYDKWRTMTLQQRSAVVSDMVGRNIWKQMIPEVKTQVREIYASYLDRTLTFIEGKANIQFERGIAELDTIRQVILGDPTTPPNLAFWTRNFDSVFRPVIENISDIPIINIDSLRNSEAFFVEWTKLFMLSPGATRVYEPLLREVLEDFLRTSPIRKLLELEDDNAN